MTVEVFRTNVQEQAHAKMLTDQIHLSLRGHSANFDLFDCDKVLRVVSRTGAVEVAAILRLLKDFGFQAEILPDEIPELSGFL